VTENAERIYEHLQRQSGIRYHGERQRFLKLEQEKASAGIELSAEGPNPVRATPFPPVSAPRDGDGRPSALSPVPEIPGGEKSPRSCQSQEERNGESRNPEQRLAWAREMIRRAREGWSDGQGFLPLKGG
jgi:hypothetical protein